MSTNTSRIIEVTISPMGETTVQTKGFRGQSCRDASRFVERALGKVVQDRPTAEMYQSQSTAHQVNQNNG
ncbi:DUF2997 domain-containing protein [Humisphaera borealis]|uniref:DUF2997 domain-containing protein n=1 Tax=Humisphaera borealis TaxID=2807512 RepID=A0A7M2WWC2_9BACT|nr:DUF2997 domain-containing protein [Humisphaera borealis]QOV89766.1 DUF2997 domain-containing protein [Humisphaera borealis]